MNINLVVNATFVNCLYELLNNPALQAKALDCLSEIISKGMKPQEKIALIDHLNVIDTLNMLKKEKQPELDEQMAAFVNILGCHLCKFFLDEQGNTEITEAAYVRIQPLLPYLLTYLGNADDETCQSVFPFTGDILSLYKKVKRGDSSFGQAEQQFISALLRTVVMKMKIDQEEWDYSSDESLTDRESEAAFMEMRKSLKTFFDAIAVIDENVFLSYLDSAVSETLSRLPSGPLDSMDWRDVELALHTMFITAEANKNLVQFPANAANLSPMGVLLVKLLMSPVADIEKPVVQISFFECLVRYVGFFEVREEYIAQALAVFVGPRYAIEC